MVHPKMTSSISFDTCKTSGRKIHFYTYTCIQTYILIKEMENFSLGFIYNRIINHENGGRSFHSAEHPGATVIYTTRMFQICDMRHTFHNAVIL